MLIVADSNIPYAEQAFASIGEVRTLPWRALTPEAVRGADILLVRSTIRVDAALLSNASPRFVGTATIGTDHVDTEYLRRRGIPFASAPGSNAESVAEWWSAAVLFLAARLGWTLAGRTVGVIGVGNVGSRVAGRAGALGMNVLKCDPPLQRATGDGSYRPLSALLECSDIVTLHVPLERAGLDPTVRMADRAFFARMRPESVFINAARGKVHDTAALIEASTSGHLAGMLLDVWENEPLVEPELLERADIGTPHIAGHSFDGKVNGTDMLYAEVCRLLGLPRTWRPADSLPPPDVPRLDLDGSMLDSQLLATEAALSLYPIFEDDARLRETLTMRADRRAAHFAALRSGYPVRRAFAHTVATINAGTPEQRATLTGLGFRVE